MAWLKSLMALLRGDRKTESGPAAATEPDDIVARTGLSHAPAPDPISDAAKIVIERQKTWRSVGTH